MSADPAAVEALAKTLRKSIYGNAECVDPEEREWLPREVAADLIGSDWLAARDAAMRAEGARSARVSDAMALRYAAAVLDLEVERDEALTQAMGVPDVRTSVALHLRGLANEKEEKVT